LISQPAEKTKSTFIGVQCTQSSGLMSPVPERISLKASGYDIGNHFTYIYYIFLTEAGQSV
jgi:hypothetical protein